MKEEILELLLYGVIFLIVGILIGQFISDCECRLVNCVIQKEGGSYVIKERNKSSIIDLSAYEILDGDRL